jgi:glycosyltransferase involved in cell wall biosynthesis
LRTIVLGFLVTISIVTITYNNFEELVKTVDSVRSVRDCELVIINGGSCQKTKDYLAELSLPGFKLVVVSESDRGIADAFNKGVLNGTGDAICFLNSGDTLMDVDYFSRAAKYFKDHDDVSFIHASLYFDDQLAGVIELKPSMLPLGRGMPYRHQSMIVRREVFQKIGLFKSDLRYTMDYDFVCRMHVAGCKGYYDQTRPVMLMDGKGVSSTKELEAYRECQKVLKDNGLWNVETAWGSLIRYGTYFVRRLLIRLKLQSLLVFLKRLKHG